MNDLETTATAAGLHDPDLLKLAKFDLSPAEAVDDLRRRYPGAFQAWNRPIAPPTAQDVRGMSRQDARAEINRYLADVRRYQMQTASRDETARMMKTYAEKDRSRRR